MNDFNEMAVGIHDLLGFAASVSGRMGFGQPMSFEASVRWRPAEARPLLVAFEAGSLAFNGLRRGLSA